MDINNINDCTLPQQVLKNSREIEKLKQDVLVVGGEAKGEWQANIQYTKNDIVYLNGSSYFATQGSQGYSPAIPSNIPIYWQLLAEKGNAGIQGEQGIRGERGIQGVRGEKGETGNGIVEIQQGIPRTDNGYTYTPLEIEFTDGTSQNLQIGAKDGLNGTNGANGANGLPALTYSSDIIYDGALQKGMTISSTYFVYSMFNRTPVINDIFQVLISSNYNGIVHGYAATIKILIGNQYLISGLIEIQREQSGSESDRLYTYKVPLIYDNRYTPGESTSYYATHGSPIGWREIVSADSSTIIVASIKLGVRTRNGYLGITYGFSAPASIFIPVEMEDNIPSMFVNLTGKDLIGGLNRPDKSIVLGIISNDYGFEIKAYVDNDTSVGGVLDYCEVNGFILTNYNF